MVDGGKSHISSKIDTSPAMHHIDGAFSRLWSQIPDVAERLSRQTGCANMVMQLDGPSSGLHLGNPSLGV